MDGLQDKESAGNHSDSCLKKLVRRPITWEISDSETEEDTNNIQRDDQKCPELKVETTETSAVVQEEVEEKATALTIPVPTAITPSPTKRSKKRRSPEELEADKAQAEQKKNERELKKQEKKQQRELEKMEREKRKDAALALKLLRPDQSVKYMTVQMDAGLLEDAGSEDVLEALRSSGYNYSIEPLTVPRSFTWRREMPSNWKCVDGLDLMIGEEDEMLVLMEPKDFLSSVCAHAKAASNSSSEDQGGGNLGPVFKIPAQYPERKVTLVVMGLQEYRWCNRLSRQMERQSLDQREGRDSGKDQSESFATRQQIQEALVLLQLTQDTEVICLNTWKELGQHVCAVTKSLAQRPFRKHWEAQTYSFCTSAGSWRGWGPRGVLSGLPLTWKRQIQQFNRVSPAMAAAVTQAYPSPQLLMQAYGACSTERERIRLLSDLRVPRESNTGATEEEPPEDVPQEDDLALGRERRIGPDLSRRIWLFMTSTNPELVLDLNS
ncbi:putative crossover junction endonuclease EME2 [Rhinophrynus dorsalis]